MGLEQEFLRLCGELENRPEVLYTEKNQDKHMTFFSLYFRVIRVELVYSRKWETLAPPSVLYCRFYLGKNDCIYLHLPELMAYLGAEDYRACYFPYIESPRRMEDCFRALMGIVDDYIPVAEALGSTGQDRAILQRWAAEGFFEDPKAKEKKPQEQVDWDAMVFLRLIQEGLMVARHTNLPAYEAFLKGDREKALKKYEKLKKNGLSLYEKGLVRFLQSEKSRNFQPMPEPCFAQPHFQKAAGQMADLKGMAVMYGIFAALYCALMAILNAVYAHGTVYYLGEGCWYGLIMAGLPAIFGYFVFQRRIQKRLGNPVEFLDTIKAHPWVNRFAIAVFAVATAGTLALCIWVPGAAMRLYDSYGVYCTDEMNMARFEYSQVERICYISARYNEYGGRVERASYVIVLEDGRRIDLDCQASLAKQRQIVEELFPDMLVVWLDSDRDLDGL